MSIARRLAVLEQSRPEPPPRQEIEDLGALILWYAHQHNFAKAAGIAGISEQEAGDQWGDDYRILLEAVEKQQQECEAYCQAQNAKLLQAVAKKPEEEQLSPELRNAPPELKYDRRRQRDLEKRRRRRGSIEAGTR